MISGNNQLNLSHFCDVKHQLVFNFKSDISNLEIPKDLNNPFGTFIPEIGQIAAKEFQDFIESEIPKWNYDFSCQKGKMFGVLVIQKADKSFGYLGTVSGKIAIDVVCEEFVPSVFDDATDDFFINKGMTELTELSNKIKKASDLKEISVLKERRKQKSYLLQQRLFENYQFTNIHGATKNVLEIFENSVQGSPPAAAGECAAPKLLQYAIEHNLKPIAITEFWWGNTPKSKEREHLKFYPACKNKCRPILEYVLDDTGLFEKAQ